MDINTVDGATMKTYIYADSQILAQHNGSYTADRFFYLHDRLGSARLVINNQGVAQNSYTYNPFGEMFPTECSENVNVTNPFKFTGQFFDSEISQYYLRARQYDPAMMRFTGRDPVKGSYEEPLTLHKYLYCLNDPINNIDPSGKFLQTLVSVATGLAMDAKDAASGIVAGTWAEFQIHKWAILSNAAFSGVYNAWMGPESVSYEKKFFTGAIAGAVEMTMACKGNPVAGSAFAGGFTSAMNEAFSKNPELSFKTVLKVGISAGFGALEGYTGLLKKDIEAQIKFYLTHRARDVYTGLGEKVDESW
jgi:RHS repeat-associated protein